MTTRVSADAFTTSAKVRIEDLTPGERETLTEQGKIGPSGFIDIEKPEPEVLVDPRAESRRRAVDALKSVGAAAAPVPAPKEDTGSSQQYIDEIGKLNAALKARVPCPRCGLGEHETCEIVATTEDIEEFLKCVLSAQGFKKSYQLFGGKLKVTFKTRNGRVDDLVRQAVTTKLRSSEINSETEIFAFMRQLTLAAMLDGYNTTQCDLPLPDLPTGSPEEFAKAALARLEEIPAPIQGFLKPLLTDFNAIVDLLTARARDPSFWQGTPA